MAGFFEQYFLEFTGQMVTKNICLTSELLKFFKSSSGALCLLRHHSITYSEILFLDFASVTKSQGLRPDITEDDADTFF